MARTLSIPGIGCLEISNGFGGFGYRALLLDDEADWLDEARGALNSRGVESVDTVLTIEEATERITSRRYDAVLFDVRIGARDAVGKEVQGDDWALRHGAELRRTMAVAVTAFPGSIRDRAALHERGIRIVKKSDDEEEALLDELGRLAKEKTRAVENRVAEAIRHAVVEDDWRPTDGVGPAAATAARDLFLDWIRTRVTRDEVRIWILGREYAIGELEAEVVSGSPAGQRLLAMFVRHMRVALTGRWPVDTEGV